MAQLKVKAKVIKKQKIFIINKKRARQFVMDMDYMDVNETSWKGKKKKKRKEKREQEISYQKKKKKTR